jgi:hypothetical protein
MALYRSKIPSLLDSRFRWNDEIGTIPDKPRSIPEESGQAGQAGMTDI